MKFILLVVFFVFVLSQKPFPTIPTDFTVVVERTSPLQNRTQTLVEFWDLKNDRAKIEFYNHSDVTAQLIFPSTVRTFLFR